MKGRATSVLIGGFVFGALVISALFVIFLSQSEFWVKKNTYVLNFNNSVSGLSEGSPVHFRGVDIGRVTDVRVVTDPETLDVSMPVYIEIDPRRIAWRDEVENVDELFDNLIDRGLRAQIRSLSYITGQSMIDLDIMPESRARTAERDLDYPEIPTVPSRLQEFSRTMEKLPLEELLNKLTSALEGIERTINSQQVSESMQSMNQALRAAEELLTSLQRDVPGVTDRLNTTLDTAKGVMQRTDERLGGIARNLHNASSAAENAFLQMESTLALEEGMGGKLASSLLQTLESARGTLQQAESSLAAAESVAGDAELRYELTSTIREISSAARSIRSLASFLERHPEAVWRGKGGQ